MLEYSWQSLLKNVVSWSSSVQNEASWDRRRGWGKGISCLWSVTPPLTASPSVQVYKKTVQKQITPFHKAITMLYHLQGDIISYPGHHSNYGTRGARLSYPAVCRRGRDHDVLFVLRPGSPNWWRVMRCVRLRRRGLESLACTTPELGPDTLIRPQVGGGRHGPGTAAKRRLDERFCKSQVWPQLYGD